MQTLYVDPMTRKEFHSFFVLFSKTFFNLKSFIKDTCIHINTIIYKSQNKQKTHRISMIYQNRWIMSPVSHMLNGLPFQQIFRNSLVKKLPLYLCIIFILLFQRDFYLHSHKTFLRYLLLICYIFIV